MNGLPKTRKYLAHVVFWVCLFLAWPLWREFQMQEQPVWNVFLAAILLAVVAGSFFGVRYLQKNDIDVGEARFTAVDRDAR
jgi:hypothetical protein